MEGISDADFRDVSRVDQQEAEGQGQEAVTARWALWRGTQPLGLFRSARSAQTAAERVIYKATGMPKETDVRSLWRMVGNVALLNYGRDQHDFRFRVRQVTPDV